MARRLNLTELQKPAVIDLFLPEDNETAGKAEEMLPVMWKKPLVLQL